MEPIITLFFRVVFPTFSGLSKVSKAILEDYIRVLGFEFWNLYFRFGICILSQLGKLNKLTPTKADENKLYALNSKNS
jgi:hypothetical protein